ncbi:MAG: methyltransferase domain-containing protein [Candidatus Omnitrophica bacterium]|nr:methyltransferase domain-containing protein [Candidatus Omnitrophota bacterium]MDD5553094.1 methyltransferase domain-containing protein [Candidatus Omnitrophota bacterium]
MLESNLPLILERIKDSDIVLDVGGCRQPFNRANWVIDFMPFETRGKCGSCAGPEEHFNKKTWIQRDVCDRSLLPFKDKEIDFVICSHVLEDIRDPVFLCSEICRIGKKGYIEVPSKYAELSFGIENPHYAGYSHHRWIVEVKDNTITFLVKPHFIHYHWKHHFPKRYGRHTRDGKLIQYLFWEGSFKFEERMAMEHDTLALEIEGFIRSKAVYPRLRYNVDKIWDKAKAALRKHLKSRS